MYTFEFAMKSDLSPALDSKVGKVILQKAWVAEMASGVWNSL